MGDATVATRASALPLRSKRLLALAGDDRLVERIRRGDELAFEVAFERHGGGILGFCRHMLGSREEAEDAVQQTFVAALRDIERGGERRIALKPWLYTIARNRCVSMLRARREHAAELQDLPTEDLDEQVARRLELRELLSDVRDLPDEQRAALLLAETGGMSHAEVASVLGCEVARVKALVFRARSGLIERRAARETPCAEIREQLANLRGGSLRRSELRHHLRLCPGCALYRDEVRRQRQMLGAALPVAPTLGLKSTVLGAVGLGGGSAAGGLGPALASLVSGTVAKVAVAGAVGGSVVAGGVAVERVVEPDGRAGGEPPAVQTPARAPAGDGAGGAEARRNGLAGAQGERMGAKRGRGERMGGERGRSGFGQSRRAGGAPGRKPGQGRGANRGSSQRGERRTEARGRGGDGPQGRAPSAPNGSGRGRAGPGQTGGGQAQGGGAHPGTAPKEAPPRAPRAEQTVAPGANAGASPGAGLAPAQSRPTE